MENRIRTTLPLNCTLLSQIVQQNSQLVYDLEKELSILGWMDTRGVINSQYLNTDIFILFKSSIDTYNQSLQDYQNCVGNSIKLIERGKFFTTFSDGSIKYNK